MENIKNENDLIHFVSEQKKELMFDIFFNFIAGLVIFGIVRENGFYDYNFWAAISFLFSVTVFFSFTKKNIPKITLLGKWNRFLYNPEDQIIFGKEFVLIKISGEPHIRNGEEVFNLFFYYKGEKFVMVGINNSMANNIEYCAKDNEGKFSLFKEKDGIVIVCKPGSG